MRWLSCLLLVGCGASLPRYTVNVPPHLADVRPRRSVAFVEETVPLRQLEQAIDQAIPPTVTGDARGHELSARWNLQRRPVRLGGGVDGLSLTIALVGDVDASLGPLHCRASDAGVELTATVQPVWTPTGQLGLDSIAVKPRVVGSLACAGIPVPLPSLLDAALGQLERALRAGLSHARLPLGPLVSHALEAASTPRNVEILGAPMCLDLDARALVLAPLGGADEQMTLRAGLDVAPRVTLGACTPVPRRLLDRIVVKTVPLGHSFALAVAVAVPYAELEKVSAPLVIGRRFGKGARSIVVSQLQLGDASGRVLARIEVRGGIEGTLSLWGTPTLVEEHGRLVLRVPDLHAAVETRSAVQRLRVWLWTLIDGGLEPLLRKQLVLAVTDRVDALRAALSGKHAFGPIALTTTLDRLVAGDVTSQPGAVVLYPVLSGSAELGPE